MRSLFFAALLALPLQSAAAEPARPRYNILFIASDDYLSRGGGLRAAAHIQDRRALRILD